MKNIGIGTTEKWVSLTASMRACRVAQRANVKCRGRISQGLGLFGFIYDQCMAKRKPHGHNNKNHVVGRLCIVYLRPNNNNLF